MVRHPFLHYSALFLSVFPYFTYTRFTFFRALLFWFVLAYVSTLFMLYFIYCAFFSRCNIFLSHVLSFVFLPRRTIFIYLHYFFGCIFTWCASSQLHLLQFAYYVLCMLHIFFMFWFFHVSLFSFFNLSLPVDPFSCCTIFIFRFYMLHLFHVAFLTVCIVPATLFNVVTHSWSAFCHAVFSSCCLPVANFSCDTFWCYIFFMSHFFSLLSSLCILFIFILISC